VGKRPGAAVSLSRLAGLPQAVGRAGRWRVGTGARLLPRPIRTIQRNPGSATLSAGPVGTGAGRMSPHAPRRVLMTADTVGGVWTFAIELCAALARRNVEVTLFTMGRLPDEAQLAEVGAQRNVRLVSTAY